MFYARFNTVYYIRWIKKIRFFGLIIPKKYGGLEIQKKLLEEQDGRLRADIVDIATKAEDPHVLADVLYGPVWRKEVEKYKRKTKHYFFLKNIGAEIS